MIKYFIIIINLLSWNCTTTVVTPSVSQVRYETTKDFVLPRVSEFKEVGRTTGTVCYESFLWMEDYIDKESKNIFQYKALNDFNIEYLSKEDRTLFLAAYSEALAKSPKSDVVVNTRFTRKDENGKVCGTVSGEGLEISKIDSPNPMETRYKKLVKMATLDKKIQSCPSNPFGKSWRLLFQTSLAFMANEKKPSCSLSKEEEELNKELSLLVSDTDNKRSIIDGTKKDEPFICKIPLYNKLIYVFSFSFLCNKE